MVSVVRSANYCAEVNATVLRILWKGVEAVAGSVELFHTPRHDNFLCIATAL